MRLLPRLHAGSDAYPGLASRFMRRLHSIALAQHFCHALHLPPYLNRFAGGRVVLGVVQVQKTAQRRGDLVLVDGFSVPPFAAQRAVGADERHPDVLRLGNFVAVIRPVLWRGATPKDWTDHGDKVPEAQHIWMAFISPDSPLRGEWRDRETIYQNQ